MTICVNVSVKASQSNPLVRLAAPIGRLIANPKGREVF